MFRMQCQSLPDMYIMSWGALNRLLAVVVVQCSHIYAHVLPARVLPEDASNAAVSGRGGKLSRTLEIEDASQIHASDTCRYDHVVNASIRVISA